MRTATPSTHGLAILSLSLLGLGLLAATGHAEDSPKGPPAASNTEAEAPAALSACATRLMADVHHLADPKLRGRHAWEDRKQVAAWIEKRGKALGLASPPGRASMIDDHGGKLGKPEFRHVLAWLPGHKAPDDRFLIVATHYTGWGVRGGKVCPSANDNATGVAALLEIVRGLATTTPTTPRRAILFAFFDKRTYTSEGPDEFLAKPPVPMERCAGLICLDMLGRAGFGIAPNYIFAIGSEHSAALADHVRGVGAPAGGSLAQFRRDLHIERTTYTEFANQSVPFVYVSGGLSLDRTQPGDTPEKLDVTAFEARTRWCHALTARVACAEDVPTWRKAGPPEISEIKAIRALLDPARADLVRRKADELILRSVDNCIKAADGILERGTVTARERRMVVLRVMGLLAQTVNALR